MLDKATRRDLRSFAAKEAGLRYDSIEVKGIRGYSRLDGATWPYSDVFCKLLIAHKFPRLTSNPKQAVKAKKLFTLIFLFFRLGLPAAQIARSRRIRLKTLESQLQRIEALAVQLITSGNLTAQNGESFFQTRRKTSPARDLVKDCQIVTQHYSDLNFLMTLADANIQYQVLRVLAELAEQQQELHAVYQHDSELPLAA
jgi:hypothetical protein